MATNKNIGRARILQQLKNMQKEPVDYLHAEPLEHDIYTWHFTFRGPQNTDFHEGIYHGQILLPFQYPFKPPDIIFSNKNGRFQVNTKICLTITQYHAEQWNSAWTIRTMLEAVISLFNQKVMGHGYIEGSSETRKFLAKFSQEYSCQKCGKIIQIIKPRQPIQKMMVRQPPAPPSIEQMAIKFESSRKKQLEVKQQKKQRSQKLVLDEAKNHSREEKINLSRQETTNMKKKSELFQQRTLQSIEVDDSQKYLNKNQMKHLKNKKLSPQVYFLNTLVAGNLEYLKVANSKKVLNL